MLGFENPSGVTQQSPGSPWSGAPWVRINVRCLNPEWGSTIAAGIRSRLCETSLGFRPLFITTWGAPRCGDPRLCCETRSELNHISISQTPNVFSPRNPSRHFLLEAFVLNGKCLQIRCNRQTVQVMLNRFALPNCNLSDSEMP